MYSSYVHRLKDVTDYTLCSRQLYFLTLLFVSTLYFPIISSYVNVQTKSGTTQCVVAGCAFWYWCLCLFLTFVWNVFSHKVTVPTLIVQLMYKIVCDYTLCSLI